MPNRYPAAGNDINYFIQLNKKLNSFYQENSGCQERSVSSDKHNFIPIHQRSTLIK